MAKALTCEVHLGDNIKVMQSLHHKCVVAYADMIYENLDFGWVKPTLDCLTSNGVLIVQTDHHSVCQLKLYLDSLGLEYINWCIYKQEWGGSGKKCFPKKHDDILIYSKSKNWKFHYKRIEVAKVTAGTSLDKKGTGKKIPCDVFDDLGNFHTASKERIKTKNGKNIRWQKPLKLMDRLLLPFTDVGDVVLDPFLGSGTTAEWCIRNERGFIGIENNKTVFGIAKERLNRVSKELARRSDAT